MTEELGDLLISITHKISARAETNVIKELVADYRKVEGKTAILFKMVLAADTEPTGRVCDVIFPVVSQKTIRNLAAEYHAEDPSYVSRVHRKVRRSYAQRNRRILPVIFKTLTFRTNNTSWRPLLDAITVLKKDPDKRPQFFSLNDVPLEGVVRPKWHDVVVETGPDRETRINRLNYEIVDTHGQGIVGIVGFAFCYLLGFNLIPHFKGIAKQRLVRAEPKSERAYKNLDPLFAPKPINWDLITQHYDEMIKLATALKQRTAEPKAILRRFIRGQSHPVFAALLELGKAAKTIFLCRYLSDKGLRREINSGLNVIERWNGVNAFIFYGNGNELASNQRDDHEISVLSLHLLHASMIYVNTLVIQDILADQTWRAKMTNRDLAALNPLPYSHINPYGVFDLDMNTRLPLNDMPVAA